MTNAQQVFETAMALMDELDSSGKADNADNREYKDRSLYILNSLIGELFPYSDNFPKLNSGRPTAEKIMDFNSPIGLDDFICRSLLPYGLAAQLLLNEDPEGALWCENKYKALCQKLKSGCPAGSEEIEDVYGGMAHGEFSAW